MRTPSTDLHQLIHSLSQEESRHFKRQLRSMRSTVASVTQRIFEIVATQSLYDEADIREKLGMPPGDGRFASAKNYLYHALLDALADLQAQRGPSKRIRQQLRMVEVLFHKELLAPCQRLLNKVASEAQTYGHPALVLEVQDWQRRLWNKRFYKDVDATEVHHHIADMDQAMLHFQVLSQLQSLHLRFMHTMRTSGFLHDQKTLQDMHRATMDHPLLNAGSEGLGLHARIPYLHTWGLYKTLAGEASAAHVYLAQLVSQLNQHPDLAYDYFELYINAHYNFGVACLRLDRHHEVAHCIAQLERLRADFGAQKARLFACIFLLKVEWHTNMGEFDAALAIGLAAREHLVAFRGLLSTAEHTSVCVTLAFILFMHGKLGECTRLINQEMQPESIGHDTDLLVAVEVLRVALYLALEDEDLLQASLRALSRFIGQGRGQFRFEKELVRSAPRLLQSTSGTEKRAAYRQLLETYTMIAAEPAASRPVPYFNFEIWLQAEAQGATMRDVLRKSLERT